MKKLVPLKGPMSSSSLSLLISLTLFLLLSRPCTSMSTHEFKHTQNPQTMNMNLDPLEKETLFHIMETMSLDKKWRLTHPNPCKQGSTWAGIECKLGKDNHLHVSRLDFGRPPNPSCKKTATFPSDIFNLPYIESVFFFNCFTHTETAISIPLPATHKTMASSLQQLSLRSNQALTGPIPPQISTLKALQILTLSQNRLQGKIPEEISSLTFLLHLDLSYNFLNGTIPNHIGSLRNLVGLDLSYNSLTGPVPETIGQMGLMQKLDLSSNSLTGDVPSSLGNLTLLIFMAMSNNRLKGSFPRGLSRLQNLQYLIMEDNPMFVELPSDLGQLVRLQELRLANSGYSGSIPASFAQLLNLRTLSLQNNRLTGAIPAGLSRLSHIYHLNLSRNMLGGVVPFGVGFLKRLGRNMDLSGNPGLCLNGSDGVAGMKIGVDVCGYKKNSSAFLPLKRSEAPSGFYSLCNLVIPLGVWALYLRLF